MNMVITWTLLCPVILLTNIRTVVRVHVLFCVLQLVLCCNVNELNVTKSCPDPGVPHDKDEWNTFQQKCEEKNQKFKFHCHQITPPNYVTYYCSYCAVPEKCEAGQYPHYQSISKVVTCVPCATETFQPEGNLSYTYKHASCDRNWAKGDDSKIECKPGSATEDRSFECDREKDFYPDSSGCSCFKRDDPCSCFKCEEGTKLNKNSTCVPIPSTTTAATSTSTTITPSSSTTNNVDVVAVVVPVVLIFLVLIVGGAVYLCARYRPWDRRNGRQRSEDEEEEMFRGQGEDKPRNGEQNDGKTACCNCLKCTIINNPSYNTKGSTIINNPSYNTKGNEQITIKGGVKNFSSGDGNKGDLCTS